MRMPRRLTHLALAAPLLFGVAACATGSPSSTADRAVVEQPGTGTPADAPAPKQEAAQPEPEPPASSTPTCQQYAKLGPDTGLMTEPTKAQKAAILRMLEEHNREPSEQNLNVASLQIIAYCNIYGGHAGSNANSPIDSIPGLKE